MAVEESFHLSCDVSPVNRASQYDRIGTFYPIVDILEIILLVTFLQCMALPAPETVLNIIVIEIYHFSVVAPAAGTFENVFTNLGNIPLFSACADDG